MDEFNIIKLLQHFGYTLQTWSLYWVKGNSKIKQLDVMCFIYNYKGGS